MYFFHNICVKLQVDCFFLSFFPSSVFSPLASPLWTSLIVSLWLIGNDKASGVTYVCYRLLCHRMTCEGLLPPPSTVPLGETFWTIRISGKHDGGACGETLSAAISLRIFWEMRHRKLLQSLNQCQWCGALRSMHGLDGFRRLSIRVWPSGRGSVWINPAAVQSRTPFLKGIHRFFKQIPTSNKLFSERLCTRKTYSIRIHVCF